MQFVRKSFFGPKNLSNRKKKYFSLLKEKGLIESVHIKKVSNTKAIYDFYQENSKHVDLSYGTDDTKKSLVSCARHRCCFCGRYFEDNEEMSKTNFKVFSIEHFYEECNYPLKILNWNNLFPSCKDCNGNRGSKPLHYLYSPSSIRFKRDVKKLLYLSNGTISTCNDDLKSLLEAYGLNSDRLKYERREFYKQISNPDFARVLRLEKENDVYKNQCIIFIDEYQNYLLNKKRTEKMKSCKLFKMIEEVAVNE